MSSGRTDFDFRSYDDDGPAAFRVSELPGRTSTVSNTSSTSGNVTTQIKVTENIKKVASNELVSIDVIPFIRAQKIYFRATGLRPSCRHFVFFDRKPVDVWCRQENFETISNDPTEYGNQYNNATEHPEGTTQLFSNSNGILEGSFFLPNTDAISFRTGEREFRLIDISVYDLDTAISTAFTTFTANGLIENRRDVYLKTTTILTTRTVTTTVARRSAGGGGGGGSEVSFDVDGDGIGDFSGYSQAQAFVDANGGSVSRVQNDVSPGFNRNTGVRGDYDNDGEKDDPSVICSALYSMGMMPEDIYQLDEEYGRLVNMNDPSLGDGYRFWATPVAEYIKGNSLGSKITLFVISTLAKSWSEEMAHIMRPNEYKSNIFGKILMNIGYPICRVIGNSLAKKHKEKIR